MSSPQTYLNWPRVAFQVFLIFVTLLGNVLVILSIVVVKHFRRPKNYLILSLAVADILVGCLVLPLKMVINELELGAEHSICFIWIAVDILCCAASIFSLIAITLDRYVAIAHPLYYRAKVRSKSACIAITTIWIAALVLTVLYWVPNVKSREEPNQIGPFPVCIDPGDPWFKIFVVVATYFLPLGVMGFVYGKIWIVLSTQKAKHSVGTPVRIAEATSVDVPRLSSDPSKMEATPDIPVGKSETLQEKKGSIMIGVVIGGFLLCWTPFFSMWLAYAISQILGKPIHISHVVYDTILSVSYSNSSINPIIYTMFSKDFRFAFKEILCLRGFSINSRIRSLEYTRQVGIGATDLEPTTITTNLN